MEWINEIIPENYLYAIGWMLVHSLWQIAGLGLVLWFSLGFLHKKSAALKYRLGVITLFVLVLSSISTAIFYFEPTGELTTNQEIFIPENDAIYLPTEFEPYQLGAAVLFVGQLFNAFILFEYHQNYLGHFRTLAYSKLGLGILGLIAKLAVLWYGMGIGALFWVVGLEFAAVGVLQYQIYKGHNKSPTDPTEQHGRLTPAWFNWQHGKELLRRSSWLWVSGILSVVYLRIDLIMIERLIDIEAAGVYAAVSRISELWYVIPATLAVRYYPELLKSHQSNWSGYLLLLRKYCGYFFAMALSIAVIIFIVAPPLVPLIFGEKFNAGISVLQIHIWAGVFIFIRYLIGQHLIITGQEPLSLASHGIGAVLNVLLNWWLIPIMGIDGAAWATLISYAYASFFFLFFSGRTRRQLWQLMKVKASGVVVEKETV